MLLVQLPNKTINLELIRLVEKETVPVPAVRVTWANGDKEIFRDDDARALLVAIDANSDVALAEGIPMSEFARRMGHPLS